MLIDTSKIKLLQAQANQEKKYKILIVDDEPHNLTILSSLLNNKFDVISANSGDEALEWLQANDISNLAIILTDQRMPDMSGMRLLEKSLDICPDCQRMIVTGYTDIDSLMSGINNVRIFQFIVKPFVRNQMLMIVDRAIEAFEREKELTRRALYDSLTGLPNRDLFFDRIQEKVKQAKRDSSNVCVALFDLRRLRTVNDTLGHSAGDELIIGIARRIEAELRGSDTVARMTGAQFGIVTPCTGVDDAMILANKLLVAVEQQFMLNNVPIDVSGCIGMSFFNTNGEDANTLLQKAEIALDSAKKRSKAYQVYDNNLGRNDVSHLSLMGELRNAIDTNALSLHYQPKLDLKTDSSTHAEALIRWTHSTRGAIFPDEFIPLAEQTGNIVHLTRWVIRNALEQIKFWHNNNLDVVVAVNISTVDLNSKGLSKFVMEALNETGISANKLILEVTESSIMMNATQAIEELHLLKKIGVNISIDDFGTGFSSMLQLKKMPVSELKIDRSFIMDLETNADDRAIVKATIMMAHELGLKVVAEGIETLATYNMLKSMDCDMAQGYHMCKPIPAIELAAWMAINRNKTLI